MKIYKIIILIFLGTFILCCSKKEEVLLRHFPRGTYSVYIPVVPGIRSDLLRNIAPIIQNSIKEGSYPGAVVLAAHRGQIIYKGVFGNRRVAPYLVPMTFDTIFDIASLTKVVATTPAVMQLIEQGKLQLDVPVATYWPEFADNGKETVTIRELLTHTSGLQPDLINPESTPNILKRIASIGLANNPGTKVVYSDLNFAVLAHLVEIITGERIDHYAANHIFLPLGMNNTFFLPPFKMRNRIAPTDTLQHEERWGTVNDRLCHVMGGVSGNAGVFSDAQDLGIYAQYLVSSGRTNPDVLGALTILKMTTPQTPPDLPDIRGLGWDIDSSYSNRGTLFSTRSFGHTGWTGTSIWIDPDTQTWIIILTSRTHPSPEMKNPVVDDRRKIANIIAASITDIPPTELGTLNNTGRGELSRAYHQQ